MQIKPQHLRVGNLIYDHECEPHIFKVEEIKKNNQGVLAVYYRNGSCMATEVDGVVLSEDLLVNKFGFKKSQNAYYWFLEIQEDRFFVISKENTIYLTTYPSIDHYSIELLKHGKAHQLQNLFQDFTETELTAK